MTLSSWALCRMVYSFAEIWRLRSVNRDTSFAAEDIIVTPYDKDPSAFEPVLSLCSSTVVYTSNIPSDQVFIRSSSEVSDQT